MTKKDAARFTIQFNAADPAHRRTIDLLNNLGRRSKAQYLVNAVLCYEAQYAPQQAPQSLPRLPEAVEIASRSATSGQAEVDAIVGTLEAFRR